jgi:squalene-hopene/tetraprenyl-beta-curcumene cyclase
MDLMNGEVSRILERYFGFVSTATSVDRRDASASPRDLDGLSEEIAEAAERSSRNYLQEQHEDGYWWYELESNVTITSEYLMLLHFIGLHDAERDERIARHILNNQRPDGTWAIHWGGEGDLSTTVEAYFALKLAGFSSDDPRLAKSRQFILRSGGVEGCRVFTRIFLALFGEFDWKAIPSIPVEVNLMPSWFPMSIYRMSSWARCTFVPLSIVLDLRPVRPIPEGARIRELYRDPHRMPSLSPRKLSPFSWQRFFLILDRVIKAIEKTPFRMFRKKALRFTERWVREHQEHTGDWGGIQPAMVNAILALSSLGHDVSHEPIQKGLLALERFTLERDGELVLQSCISPIWDTALTSLALLHAGVDKGHPGLIEACRWLASKQIFKKGDWSIRRPNLEPGGWAFEFENSWFPDVDDSAVVLMLLYRYADEGFIDRANLEKGLSWILGMQGSDGGWGAFDADNNMRILNQLPLGDLEAMIDPSTPDLTGRVLELLGQAGYGTGDRAARKAIRFIRKTQDSDGSWWGRWGVNHIYGTCTVLSGLGSIGEDMNAPYVRKAVHWIRSHQNHDGGWGECCESYADASLKCRGASTPSQTAWAMLALMAAGEEASEEVIRGVQYLLKRQKDDGTWDEEWFTGTGFPKYFMLRYHNYRNCFPLMALGRFLSVLTEKGMVR